MPKKFKIKDLPLIDRPREKMKAEYITKALTNF